MSIRAGKVDSATLDVGAVATEAAVANRPRMGAGDVHCATVRSGRVVREAHAINDQAFVVDHATAGVAGKDTATRNGCPLNRVIAGKVAVEEENLCIRV